MSAAPQPAPNQFSTAAELHATQEAKRCRRAEMVELIKDAGINPAEIDVTKVLSDTEAAEAIRQQAARRKAQQLASEVSRDELRARLKATVKNHEAKVTMRLPSGDLGENGSAQ